MLELTPPWEIDGVPYHLSEEVFACAADVWVLHMPQVAAPHRIQPAMGVWGHYAGCSGNGYDHNRARTERLLAREPMYEDQSGGRAYPAIFAPDPTLVDDDDAKPLAVITAEGYVGSAWGALATEFAPRVINGFRPDVQGGRSLYATVVHIFRDPIPGVPDFRTVRVWVPRPERKR